MEFSPADYFKMMYSVGLVIFSIIIVTALMWDENTKVARDASPIVAFIVMWVCILWMSMVEGGQCSMVGLPPIDRELYHESHPITFSICSIGHKGDNLDRYLMGRQFLVIFINFTISMCGAPLAGVEVLGLPDWIQQIFLVSGIAMVLTNVTIGQLTAQCNASHCMLDYINTHFMTFTLYVTLIIEKTGVMHVCYLIRDCFYWAAGKEVVTREEPRDAFRNFFHWGRVLFSIAVLVFALTVTIVALLDDKTTMWKGVPHWLAIVLFVTLMCVVGMLEGMQIAFFAVSKLREEERGSHPMAVKTCELLFRGEGRNLPGFMVGRQMTVTLCFFIIARVTSINVTPGTNTNIFDVPDPVQEFFNMGFLGAIVTTILASISWQLVAGAFPLQFLSNPMVYLLLNCALFLEFTGICHAAWFFAIIHKKVAGFQLDEVYVGTAAERAAKGKADKEDAAQPRMGAVGLVANVAHLDKDFMEVFSGASYSDRRAKIMANIKMLRESMDNAFSPEEKQAYKDSIAMEVYSLRKVNEAHAEVTKQAEEDKKKYDEAVAAQKRAEAETQAAGQYDTTEAEIATTPKVITSGGSFNNGL